MMDMATTKISSWDRDDDRRLENAGGPCPPYPAWISRLLRAFGASACLSLALWAQAPDPQAGDANKPWTSTTESHGDNLNPTRTSQSHTQNGNRTLDTHSVQRRGSSGSFEPYQDIETESVQVDSTTVRTTTRTFVRDANGAKTLMQVTDEEKHIRPGGDSSVVRATSNPDVNGKLQVVQRQVEETKKISKNEEETKTTVMLPSINGGMAPAMKMQELRRQGANESVESHKTTLLPDGAGNWQVGEVRDATSRKDGDGRSLEERVSRPDSEGKLSEISRTVSRESGSSSGEKRSTVESYSADAPGSARDGSLHLVERAITTQRSSPSGQQTTERRVEQANPGDPHASLRLSTRTIDVVRSGPSGAQATRTNETRDSNGSVGVVSVDTTNSDNVHAIQVQIAPSEKPK
jgi:hypothetical protein